MIAVGSNRYYLTKQQYSDLKKACKVSNLPLIAMASRPEVAKNLIKRMKQNGEI